MCHSHGEPCDFPQMQTSSFCNGNTNSQFYMWEPSNPMERAAFEEDLIASTNENLYVNPLPCKVAKAFTADSNDLFYRSSLFHDDLDEEPISESLLQRGDEDDFELDLEMNDLLDEFDEPSGIVEVDIFADERDNCGRNDCDCKKKKSPKHDYAMDSTFVSMLQCEPLTEQTFE